MKLILVKFMKLVHLVNGQSKNFVVIAAEMEQLSSLMGTLASSVNVVKFNRLPGLHAWLDFNHFVRDVDHTDGDFSRLWVVLPLEEVVHSSLQIVPQLGLGKPCIYKVDWTHLDLKVWMARKMYKTQTQHRFIAPLTFGGIFVLFSCFIWLFQAAVTYKAVMEEKVNIGQLHFKVYYKLCNNNHQ